MARILIILSSLTVLALPVAGCATKQVRVTQHPLVVHHQPVKLTLKREGFDAVQRIGEVVDGIVHLDGERIDHDMRYQDAVVLMSK
jgi:hypothetical protein